MLLLSSGAGLGLVTRYTYVDKMQHYHQTDCEVTSCRQESYPCCSSRYHCSTCYHYIVDVTLVVNDTIYKKYVISKQCNTPNTTCYYNDNDIVGTLSLYRLRPPEGLVGIVILSVFIFLIPIITLTIILCIWIGSQETLSPTPPSYGDDL